MTTYHILNGDYLAGQLRQTKINQDFIVCRECLIEGDLSADTSADFWTTRARYISETYNVSSKEYFSKTVSEFDKLSNLPDYSEVCLWFENDLFCQTNMWFIISRLVHQPTLKIFRVFPRIEHKADTWKGFGIATAENLEQAYHSKIQFSAQDLALGTNLWKAYQMGDFDKLMKLATIKSECFDYLKEVCQAHIDRFPADKTLGRPESTIQEIIQTQSTAFEVVFTEFTKREGIYGFGDLQVKHMYDRLIQ